MDKYCITCKQSGHTYMECPRVNFFDLFAGACGVEPIGGQSRAEMAQELEAIRTETSGNNGK